MLLALSDGNYHSGIELGNLVGVSRTAIWKQLQKLQELTGLEFESLKGRGYRLPGGIELLDKEAILAAVPAAARALVGAVELHSQIDSTNRQALSRAQAGAGNGYTILAEHQLAGKGRRGRSWISPFGANLYLSVIWGFENGAAALEGLSLTVGIAMARALIELGVRGVGLKWPNDIYWRGKKLGGILLEMVGDASGQCQVVIGVGINVDMPRSLAAAIEQPWCDLREVCGQPMSRNRVASAILSHLLPILQCFERDRFVAYRTEWAELDCVAGKPVVLHLGERELHGVAAGVGENGALAIETERGREWFHGGEVSLRLQQ